MSEMKRVSDVAGGSLEGEYVPMAELLDKELVISKVVDMETQFGPALGVEFHDAEGFLEGFFITSHVVVSQKLKAVREAGELPILAKITKPGRYYDIV
ncbi:MAG: hypothetical protein ACTSPX_05695 [Candidatus Thorarchaeota archaeon]